MLAAAVFDNDGFLVDPGKPYHPDVQRLIIDMSLRNKSALVGTSSGKPAPFQWRVYAQHLMKGLPPAIAEEMLSRYVIIGNNGAEAWVGVTPDGEPLRRVVFDVDANNARKAIEQLNLVADYLVYCFPGRVYEQVNAKFEGVPLMRTVFPINVRNPDMLMRYVDSRGNVREGIGVVTEADIASFRPDQIPTPHMLYEKAMELITDPTSIYALLHSDAAEVMPVGMDKAYMLRRVAEIAEIGHTGPDAYHNAIAELGALIEVRPPGLGQVNVGEYYDAIDCMGIPENGDPPDKGEGLRNLNNEMGLPPITPEEAWSMVSMSGPRKDLTGKGYIEEMKIPNLSLKGESSLVNAVVGGDNLNDLPMMVEAVCSLTYEWCKPAVQSQATHIIGGDKEGPIHRNAINVLRAADRLLGILCENVKSSL